MSENAIVQMVRERDEALLSLDREKLAAYAAKYGVALPDDESVFWLGIHKARCHAMSLPQEARDESERWLKERGSKP